jgi:acetyl-CoA acetyltransferase
VTVAHYLGLIPNGSTAPRSGSPGGRPWRAVPGIDGGGSLILVAAERARDFSQSLPLAANRGPVYLLGTGESVETPMVSQMADFTSSRAFRVAGPKAFAEAGITVGDVDHLMIYDAPCSPPGASFAHLPIYGLEDLGFVPRGEAGAFIAERNTRRGACSPAARS